MRYAGIGALLSICIATPHLAGQSQTPSPKSSFEVASIKRNVSGSFSSSQGARPGGMFSATNVPLASLIRFAYEIGPI
jgi:hypothetical protein